MSESKHSIFGGTVEFHGEGGIDWLIRKAFFPKTDYRGVFVEVGAADPCYLSISKHFRDNGWKVASIEPNPYFASRHREAGNFVLEFACGEKDEDNVEFEIARQKENGMITFESFSAIKVKENYKEHAPDLFAKMEVEKIRVRVRRLDALLEMAEIKEIDILTIDVEGWELEVLAGLDFSAHAPKAMIVENWLKTPEYEKWIVHKGYHFVCRIFPNDVYVRNGMFPASRVIMAKALSIAMRGVGGFAHVKQIATSAINRL